MRTLLVAMYGLFVAACGTTEAIKPTAPTGGTGSSVETTKPPPPFPVAYGDCGEVGATFLAGPRPSRPHATEPYPPEDPDQLDRTTINMPAALERATAVDTARAAGVGGDGPAFDPIAVRARGRRVAAVPTVSIGTATAKGDLDNAIIRRYIKRNIQKIQFCYEKELLANSSLKGLVTVAFMIDPNGKVTKSTGTGVSANVSSCVAGVIKSIEFPKPKSGSVEVTYPFDFRYAGGELESVAAQQTIYAHDDRFGGPFDDAIVGAANPLRARDAEIAACLKASGAPFGAAAIDVAYNSKGTLENAEVHGIQNATTVACVVAAAKQTTTDGAFYKRCPIAFGDMPVSAFDAIDVTATSTREAIVASVKPPAAETKEPIAIRTPRFVRVEADVTMTTAFTAWFAIIGSGDDFILGVKRGGGWQPLRARTFPTAPVSIGSAGHWAPLKGAPPQLASIDRNLVPSILVGPHDLWVGYEHDNALRQIDRDELAATLAEFRKRPALAKTTAIEIAAEGDVTYGDLVRVIDVAQTAGFVDWALAQPALLDIRPSL